MNARSANRARQERDYTVMRQQFLTDHRLCAICGGEASQVHHRAGRDGWRLLYVLWWLPVCDVCHRRVTEHPRWAVEAGWSLSRLAS